ncbi:MAG TPA: hypothetical protein VF744_11035 [Beijerinckiaceae bacterium]|jgi:antitoxin component of MazEF toxin-antitoxin module
MRTRFATWGHSIALRIPREAAREIGAIAGRAAELSVCEGKLIVEPINEAPSYDLDELLGAITPDNAHDETPTGSAVGNELA